MKNKGRRQLATSSNCKGWLTFITRSVEKMGSSFPERRGESKKYLKKKWSKRVRGYFKSQTKDILTKSE